RQVGRVVRRIGEEALFRGHHVAEVRLHRGDIRLRLRVRELRDRNRGENADDHDDDQQLDEGEALAVHSCSGIRVTSVSVHGTLHWAVDAFPGRGHALEARTTARTTD